MRSGPERVAPCWSHASRLVLVASSYYITAELGLRLALVGHSVTPLWPPTGVALVALLAFGRRVWPAIAVAAFAVNTPISPSLFAAAIIATGNTVAPLVAATLVARAGFHQRLDRVRDAATIVFLAAFAGMSISATIGTFALAVSNATPSSVLQTWLVWWTGDAMGVLIVAPFLWSLREVRKPEPGSRRLGEPIAVTLALLAACGLAFGTEHLIVVVLPLLAWIAWRYEQRGAAPAALVLSTLASVAAAHQFGPFVHTSLVGRMVSLQAFNATVALTSILLAAAVSQRERVAEREHDTVETLQRSLLPDRLSDIPGVAVAARYLPASVDVEVGGDWYDIIPLRDGRLGFAVGDVAGHGVPAAAIMGQVRMALRAYALEALTPGQAVARLNRLLRDLQPDAMATMWYGQYDLVTRTLTYSNAGHPPPLLIDNAQNAHYLDDQRGPPLGAARYVTYPSNECSLDDGAAILLYTDGLVEQRSTSIDVGLRRLRECAINGPRDLELLCDRLVTTLINTPQADDVAVLAIRPVGVTGRELHLLRRSSPDAIPETRRVIRSWLQQNSVSPDDIFDILVATAEAYSNSVRHAYGLAAGTVEIQAKLTADSVEIAVRDHGTWKNHAGTVNDGGRGIAVMHALMDSVVVDSSEQGTQVRMQRTLKVPIAHE